jgi:hypothetical protein
VARTEITELLESLSPRQVAQLPDELIADLDLVSE